MQLTQFVHRNTRQRGANTAVICGDRTHSFSEIQCRVSKLAGALKDLGLKTGDRVAMMSGNSDRFIEFYLAVWWAGGVVNPINIRWNAKEISYSLNDCGTGLVIVDETFRNVIEEARRDVEFIRHVIYAGEGSKPSWMLDYETLVAQADSAPDANRSNNDLAAILYTGGTTGFPKGVTLTHTNLGLPALSLLAAGYGYGSVLLHATPMFHGATLMFMLAQWLNGGTHVTVPRFAEQAVMEKMQQHNVTDVFLVPTMIQRLVDNPIRDQYDLTSVQRIWYGGSPIPEAVLERAMAAMPSASFVQMYGLTEVSISSLLGPQQHQPTEIAKGRLRSAGKATTVTDIKIIDTDGREVPRGTIGEISIGGPNVMQGYWNKPVETNAALKDGWMRTGDAAYMDNEGFIFIVDRLKDMIVSGGENIYATEVENAIAAHPSVAATAVIGIPDDQWGESVHAAVVLKSEAERFSLDDLRGFCKDRIASYKCPRSLEFRDVLPISGAGKVMKTVLREAFWKDRARKI